MNLWELNDRQNVHWSLIRSFCLKRKIYRWHPMQIYAMIWFICHCTKLENIFCNIFPPISNLQTWMSFHDLEFYQYNFNAMTMTRLFWCLHFVACGIILHNGTIQNVNFNGILSFQPHPLIVKYQFVSF